MDYLVSLASGIYDDIGNPGNYSTGYIYTWLLQDSNLGVLNNYIDTCFSGVPLTGVSGTITGYAIEPALGLGEQAIYKTIFDKFYYDRQSKISLSGIAGAGGYANTWTKIREADSEVVQINRVEIARIYRDLSRGAAETLKDMIRDYLRFRATPQAVNGTDTIADWTYSGPYSYDPRQLWAGGG